MWSRRTQLRASAGQVLGVLLLGVLLGVLAACGSSESARDDRSVGQGGDVRDELAAHGGRPCPKRLVEAGGDDLGGREPAVAVPELPAADRAWICRYEPQDAGPGRDGGWQRTLRPVEVPARGLVALEDRLSSLVPAEADRVCRADLGPRWLLVLSDEGDLTGVVVDDYGCRDVRLTDEPFTTVPGEGRLAGVYTGPDDLLALLKAASG